MMAFPDLDPSLLNALEEGSQSVDDLSNQGTDTAFQHAMRAPKQSPADAQSKMCDFVNQNMDSYHALADDADGNQLELQYAYQALGRALHPIMDSTSPAHAGFQIWYNPYTHPSELLNHGDFFPTSQENMEHLTPDLLNETIQRIENAMSNSDPCKKCGQ
jgi:hypothetical protein